MGTKRERMALVLLAALPLLAACERSGQEPAAEREEVPATAPGASPPTAIPTPAPGARVGEDTLGEKVDRVGDAMQAEGAKLGEAIDDAAVTARVKAALIADPTLSALQIDVDSKDGVVTLRGSVESAAASTRAGEVARGTEGVVAVDNQLVVAASG